MKPILPVAGLCAHRGCHPRFPENSVPAFQEAARIGAAMVEFDVQSSRDGAVVVLHDSTVDRTTNGCGLLGEMSLEEVRSLRLKTADGVLSGWQIPTLEEALDALPRHVWINCQIKTNDARLGERVARLLKEREHLDQTFLACGRLAADGARSVVPEVLICNMDRKETLREYVDTTLESGAAFIQLTRKYAFGREDLLPLKEHGVRINFYHARTPDELEGLFAKGVDFVLVDRLPEFLPTANALGLP